VDLDRTVVSAAVFKPSCRTPIRHPEWFLDPGLRRDDTQRKAETKNKGEQLVAANDASLMNRRLKKLGWALIKRLKQQE